MLRKSPGEIIGKSNREMFGAEAAGDIDKYVLESFDNKSTMKIEHTLPGPDGNDTIFSTVYKYFPVKSRERRKSSLDVQLDGAQGDSEELAGKGKSPENVAKKRKINESTDVGRKEAFIFGVCRDITMRKMMETAAIEATKAKTMFLANMSHDLRTPLTGIINVASLLKKSNLAKDQAELVSILCSSSSVLLSLCNDITDISKVEQQEMVLQPKSIDIYNCVQECVDCARPQATRRGLSLIMQGDDFIPIASIDPIRLRQIANNLISNAIKYTIKGKIVVSVSSCCAIKSKGTGKIQVMISVKDTGIGINEKHLETIFKPYAQVISHQCNAESRAKQIQEGSGLGLAIARGLARVMEGDISVKSVENEGSEFTAVLTAEVNSQSQIPEKENEEEKLIALRSDQNATKYFGEQHGPVVAKMKVMLVEDNCITMLVLKKLLQHFGVTNIIAAIDGLDAITKIQSQEERINLILMDWNMPQLDGLGATKIIRDSVPSEKQPQIYILTAAAMYGDRETCLLSGADGYLTKPINEEQLKRILLLGSGADNIHYSTLSS